MKAKKSERGERSERQKRVRARYSKTEPEKY